MRWDFHLHSQYSDGSACVELIFQYAKANEIKALALTDHDTIMGIQEEKRCSKKYGIPILTGAEFTAKIEGMRIHVLGYGLNDASQELQEYSNCFLNAHNERTRKQILLMQKNGIRITQDECFEQAGGGPLYRAKLLNVLSQHGYLKQEEIMSQLPIYFGKDAPYYVEDQAPYQTFPEICDLIHRNGGIAVLAHPGKIFRKNKPLYERLIHSLLLDGLEVYHYDNPEEVRLELLQVAEERGIIYTGGSDYHGIYMKHLRNLGETEIPEQVFRFLEPYLI